MKNRHHVLSYDSPQVKRKIKHKKHFKESNEHNRDDKKLKASY